MSLTTDTKKALKYLSGADPVLARVIGNHPLTIKPRETNLLEDLVSAIISQQLSTKAADTIYRRFLYLFGGKFPKPLEILDREDQELRGVGISFPKVRYVKGIAQAVIDRSLVLSRIPQLTDEQVVEELVKLKGVGQWTAEMLLIFSLNRPDIFSFGDLGLRRAVSRLYNVPRDDFEAIGRLADKWRPYRSFACRLLWLSLDNQP